MASDGRSVAVWDWTVRLFHWLLVLLIPIMWWTAEQNLMDWHRRIGLCLMGLLLFRLAWGVIGSRTARFWPMLKSLPLLPRYIAGLFDGRHGNSFGHNPMGVLSVIALLGVLTVQITTGLFSVDVDGLESGPLAILVSFDTGRWFADIHELSFNIVLGLVALHIAAILFHRFILKDRLIRPMISGKRPAAELSGQPLQTIQAKAFPVILAGLFAVAAVYLAWATG